MAKSLFSRRSRYLLYKIWALLSLVRWYNVLLIAIALYLSAIFIFQAGDGVVAVLKNWRLHIEVAALSLFIMSGYIINAFYDIEKDLVNRPQRTFFDKHISRTFSFYCYFGFNTLAGFLSALIGWEVMLVNIAFSFVLWFYSHKMRKQPFAGEIGTAMLTVAPFFSLTIFYWNITWKMMGYVAFIFVLIVGRGIIKKLMGMKGDIIYGDRSIPIVYGEQKAKLWVKLLSLMSIAQIAYLVIFIIAGPVRWYFIAIVIGQLLVIAMLSKDKVDYVKINRLFKFLLLSAVFCIAFI